MSPAINFSLVTRKTLILLFVTVTSLFLDFPLLEDTKYKRTSSEYNSSYTDKVNEITSPIFDRATIVHLSRHYFNSVTIITNFGERKHHQNINRIRLIKIVLGINKRKAPTHTSARVGALSFGFKEPKSCTTSSPILCSRDEEHRRW